MQPKQEHWIEEVSLYFERYGLAKSLGRIVGLLMISSEPLTLDDLVRQLNISKASASLSTRFGEQAGLIQRVSHTGKRKTLYRLSDNFWYRSLAARLEGYRHLRDLVTGGLQVVDDKPAEVRQRMEEMRDFLSYYLEEYPKLVARWSEQRRELSSVAEGE
jgi:DNA-binding transcriptional regulator GbsR (MarR family)